MRIPREKGQIGRQLIDLKLDTTAAILRTLEAGWMYASPYVNSEDWEVDITEHLRDGMRKALEGKEPKLVVQTGAESRSNPQVIRPDGRTDIPIFVIEIFLRFGEHDPHAIVECKRISGFDASLCRLYVVEGISRFQNGKYAANHSVAFMSGYLVSGDGPTAVGGINRYLSSKSRHSEHLRRSSVITGNSVFWSSRHARSGGQHLIRLHHAFFKLQEPQPRTAVASS